MDFSIKKIQEQDDYRYLLFDTEGGIYSISEFLFTLLDNYIKGFTNTRNASAMNALFQTNDIDERMIAETIQTTRKKCAMKDDKGDAQPYVKFARTIIKTEKAMFLYEKLSLLFSTYLFPVAFIFAILFTAYFFISVHLWSINAVYHATLNHLSVFNTVILYVFFYFILLVHEFGHASASVKFGVKPKEIGVGIYFLFPVFYTDVTSIWQLAKKERIIVNLGGIYFQLLINILLILLYLSNTLKDISFLLIFLNSTSILFSFNPFFRYDGYWIFSDFFQLPNLKEKVAFVNGLLLSKPMKVFSQLRLNGNTFIIYYIGNTCFWLFMYFNIIRYSIATFQKIIQLFHQDVLPSNNEFLWDTAISILSILIITYVFTASLIKNLKPIYYATRRVFN